MNKPWLWIVNDKRFDRGPTIPYLIGAMRIYKGAADISPLETSQIELRDLLIAMRDEIPPPACIVIQPCTTLEALVASAHRRPPRLLSYVLSPGCEGRALYYATGDSKKHDLESLVNAIWKSHEEYILEGRFSRELIAGAYRNEWAWVRFSNPEREEIRKTFANPVERTRQID